MDDIQNKAVADVFKRNEDLARDVEKLDAILTGIRCALATYCSLALAQQIEDYAKKEAERILSLKGNNSGQTP